MSLLLDALRRAEEDSRKRKQGPGDVAAEGSARQGAVDAPSPLATPMELSLQEPLAEALPPAAAAASLPELSLMEPLPVLPDEAGAQSDTASVTGDRPPVGDAPMAGAGAVLLPRVPVQSYGRYSRPGSSAAEGEARETAASVLPLERAAALPAASGAPGFSRPGPGAAAVPTTPTAAPTQTARAATAAAAQRQALSAASVMAGGLGRGGSAKKPQRRQLVLAAVALVLGLPLAAFVFFGDALLGTSAPVVVQRTSPAPLLPVEPPAAAVPAETNAPVPAPVVVAAADPGPPPAPAAVVPAAPAVRAGARQEPEAGAPPRMTREPVAARSAPAQRPAPAVAQPRTRAAPVASPAAVALVPSTARPGSLMDSAYAAYQAGKPGEATRLYQDVLRADPTQRDAWLGLAVIAHGSGQREPAAAAYRQVLRLEPQNATALAGLSSLASGAGEPLQESRLRELLARSPQEADLNHALGLVLSGEQRWSEAQPLFFKAHALAPQESQFAYNLAVALDHLRKSTLAAQYYATALGLAEGKAASFDQSSARTRLAALRARDSAGTPR